MADTEDDNLSELVDEEKFEGMQYPPDRPTGATDRTVDRDEDSVAERHRRENPDRWGHPWEDEVGPIVDDVGELGEDDEADAVAHEARRSRDPLHRDVSTQDLEEIQSAEEAAMHITEPPPMDDDDGYVT